MEQWHEGMPWPEDASTPWTADDQAGLVTALHVATGAVRWLNDDESVRDIMPTLILDVFTNDGKSHNLRFTGHLLPALLAGCAEFMAMVYPADMEVLDTDAAIQQILDQDRDHDRGEIFDHKTDSNETGGSNESEQG